MDDGSHKQLWVKSLSRNRLTMVITTTVVFLLASVFCLIAFTPVRTFIPGYPDARTRQQALRNAILIDSLENAVARWAFYSDNLLRVVEGREPIGLDSLIRNVSDSSIRKADVARMLGTDSLLRVKIASEEQFEVSGRSRSLTIEGMQFFPPIKGVIARPYDPVIHPFTDFGAPDGSLVMAALDGRIIDCHWEEENGYVITIQHDNNIVTIYKNNRKNLRHQGDKVSAGAPVAVMGEYLHFEIWYRGETVDPARYIKF